MAYIIFCFLFPVWLGNSPTDWSREPLMAQAPPKTLSLKMRASNYNNYILGASSSSSLSSPSSSSSSSSGSSSLPTSSSSSEEDDDILAEEDLDDLMELSSEEEDVVDISARRLELEESLGGRKRLLEDPFVTYAKGEWANLPKVIKIEKKTCQEEEKETILQYILASRKHLLS